VPALLDAIGVEAAVGVHLSIVSSVPPADTARTVALMTPALSVDDRAERG